MVIPVVSFTITSTVSRGVLGLNRCIAMQGRTWGGAMCGGEDRATMIGVRTVSSSGTLRRRWRGERRGSGRGACYSMSDLDVRCRSACGALGAIQQFGLLCTVDAAVL